VKPEFLVHLLTNVIPPYYLPVFKGLRDNLGGLGGKLRIFVSTPMEPNRDWTPEWDDLPVTVQKCWTYSSYWRHDQGFSERAWRHFPLDTLPIFFRERPDIVISIQLGFRTLQAAIYRKLFPKSRLIIWTGLSEHTERGLPRWRTLQRRALLHLADAVLVNGASGKRYLESLGVPSEKIFMEPYCAEIRSHLQLQLEREPKVAKRLLYVGQLVPRKGIQLFIRALSDWLSKHPTERCEFWIAGDGPIRADLERLTTQPQLHLRFLGSINYHSLPQVYAQGGIYVFPTLADEWGVVVNEALAAGLPILGSRYSQAVDELVEDGVNGWTFRPDQPEEICAAVDKMMATPNEQLDRMRRAGRKRITSLSPAFGAECFAAAIKAVRSAQVAGNPSPSSRHESREVRSENEAHEPVKKCRFCGNVAVFKFQLRHTSVWECASDDCRLQFADPQLSDETLARAYREHYYPSREHGEVQGYENTPKEILRQTFAITEGLIGSLAGRRLLDVGCGLGRLCEVAAEYGLQPVGIEPDANAREQAYKTSELRAYSSLDGLQQVHPDTRFDIVTIWDVIEHLREPWKELGYLSGMLRPGGWLLLSTPNAGSLRACLHREKWDNVVNPTHFYYFRKKSLRAVLRQAGFSEIAELRFPIRYPGHSFLQGIFHHALVLCRLQGQLIFLARPALRGAPAGRRRTEETDGIGVHAAD
jgi:glycosyltransferase involved in cell wall biosynthesis/2-polyprenyl-3-methyl-5-hydroxy-6-metoxy-1,4-benzoquinol methylase